MSSASAKEHNALEGGIAPTFFKYLIPSLAGLIAMTSASLVDGIFIGNYVGVTALAAVNLIIPITALVFGIAMMLSVGGSVRAGKYLGEKNTAAASAIFSKTLLSVSSYGVVVIGLGLSFEEALFAGLGADEALFPVMSEYYRIIMPFLFAQLIVVVLYFFVRLDGMPNLAAISLAIAAAVNIILDYWFIVIYDWGLTGAALATGLSQAIPMFVLLAYFGWPKRRLQFAVRQQRWREVFQAAYNGLSEFINEVSGGIIAFIFNWMLIERAGVDGVAAITVVNYLMLLGFMMFFSISDTIAVMVSQNFGAGEVKRIEDFLKLASIVVAVTSAVFIGLLLTMSEPMIAIFVDEKNSAEMMQLAQDFVPFFWPVFLFVGFNMLVSGYLTAVHRPFESGLIALFRSLVLPAGFLVLFYFLLTDYQFVAAVAVAEAVAFGVAMALYFRWRPSKVL